MAGVASLTASLDYGWHEGKDWRRHLTDPLTENFLVESRMDRIQRGLWMGFMRSAERFSRTPCAIVQGTTLSYRQLRETAIACC